MPSHPILMLAKLFLICRLPIGDLLVVQHRVIDVELDGPRLEFQDLKEKVVSLETSPGRTTPPRDVFR
jgi:hypothetical protein